MMTIALLALAGTAWAQPQPGGEDSGEEDPLIRTVEAVFEEDFFLDKDLMIHGLLGYGTVNFTIPAGFELVEDPRLGLWFAHSGELLPDKSDLTVLVNNVAISTVALDEENAKDGALLVDIDREILNEYNTITLVGTHRRVEDCQDPYDMSLWTRVSNRSTLTMTVRPRPVQPELLEYPYPFFDELGFGPVELAWVEGAAPPGDLSLSAAGELALGLGRLADYRGVRMVAPLQDLADATTNAVMLGTLYEHPGLDAVLGDLYEEDGLVDDQGLIAVVPNPADPSLAILVVTGATGEGVLRAVRALNGNPRFQNIAGASALIRGPLEARAPSTRRSIKPMTQGESATFAQLGLGDQTVRGYYAPQVRVPITLEGDANIRPGGGRVNLVYGYSSGLSTRLSTMEVRLNGVTLRSVPLNDADGEPETRLSVHLPPEIVTPHSFIDVVFHLYPEDYGACESMPDETHWATLYAHSEVSIPRDNYAMMPDLGRLRFRGWPYDLDGAGALIALSDAPDPLEISAAIQVAAKIGAWSTAERVNLRMVRASTALDKPVDEHRILVVGDNPHSYFTYLASNDVITAPGDVLSSMPSSRRRKIGAASYVEQVLIEGEVPPAEVSSPIPIPGDLIPAELIPGAVAPAAPLWAVTALKAQSSEGLDPLIDRITEPRVLARLDRNLAVLTGGDRVQTISTEDPVQIGEIPLTTRLRLLLQRNWATWGLVTILGAVAFASVVRSWAHRRGGQV